MSQKFKKASRLLKNPEYQAVFKTGIRVRHHFLTLIFAKSGQKRLGLVVGTRIGGAVVRNRIKRVIREGFRHWKDLLPSGDFVILPTPAAAKKTNSEIKTALQQLFSKVTA